LAPSIETLAEVFPLFPINALQMDTAWRAPPFADGGDRARLAAQDHGRITVD